VARPRRKRPTRPRPRDSAREVALRAAVEAGERGLGLRAAVESLAGRAKLDARDRRLAEEIVSGAARHRGSLDRALALVSDQPLERLHPSMHALLRQAAYQILFLDRVPVRAAVDEAVRLARAFVGRSAAPFANAVLRAVGRLVESKSDGAPPPEARAFSLARRGGGHVRLKSRVLAEPDLNLAAHLAGYYSAPEWLVARWLAELDEESTRRVLAAGLERPALWARVNPLRENLDALGERADSPAQLVGTPLEGARSAARGELPGAWRLEIEGPPDRLPGFGRGEWTVQDLASQRSAHLLAPEPGERVLDLCAAPGTKTTQLAELMRDRGDVLAVDRDPERLARGGEAARRLGLTSVRLLACDAAELPPRFAGRFDRVLVDVPCSNTAVLAARVEARWRATPEGVTSLAERQRALLLSALACARPGGRVAYSTCSLLEEENGRLVRAALAGCSDAELLEEIRTFPAPGEHGGGYVALLRIGREP